MQAQGMKQFRSFVRKEFLQIFRDRRTLLILLVMPLMLVLMLGYAIKTELNNARMAVLDPSKDAETLRIKERFRASQYFTVVEETESRARIDELFRRGDISLALVFAPDFAESGARGGREATVQLIADGTDPNQAALLTGYAQGVMAAGSAAAEALPVETRMLYNPQQQSSYNFVPGVMGLVLMLICAMMTSVAIVREKETGTMEVLLVSPMKPIYIILSKSVPYLVLSMVNLATILLLSVFVLHVPVAGSLFTLLLLSLVYIFLSLSLGLFISTMVDTQMAAILVSGMGLMMPTMLLSGLIFPIESMPAVLQWVSAVVPARWYVEAMKKIMVQGVGIEYVLTELGILTGMAAVLVVLSLKKFNVRLN